MKRYGNLWPAIIDEDNLRAAHARARQGKGWQRQVRVIDDQLDRRIPALRELLESGQFHTGEYSARTRVSAPGVGIPIGNYLSQWFANLYLAPIDWRIKQHHKVRYYHRYCDDLILLHHDKAFLHAVREDVGVQLLHPWGLTLKGNWQAFPTADRGVDFVGYRMWPEKTLLRKGTRRRMGARLSTARSQRTPAQLSRALRSVPSYDGWTRFGSCRNLRTALLDPFLDHLEATA